MKDAYFLGTALEDLASWPASARRTAGFQLRAVQAGRAPTTGSR